MGKLDEIIESAVGNDNDWLMKRKKGWGIVGEEEGSGMVSLTRSSHSRFHNAYSGREIRSVPVYGMCLENDRAWVDGARLNYPLPASARFVNCY